MKTLNNKVEKPTANDPFDLTLLIRGMVLQLIQMSSNVYEFAYTFTFKRTMKAYKEEFYDPFDKMVEDQEFFLATGDPVVINCVHAENIFHDIKNTVMMRFRLNLEDLVKDPATYRESLRFAPLRLHYKRSKSYKKLKSCYERSLLDYIKYLYQIACVITIEKHRIPAVFNKQFVSNEEQSLWLLNSEDATVTLLKDGIAVIRKQLQQLRELNNMKIIKSKMNVKLQEALVKELETKSLTPIDMTECKPENILPVTLVTLDKAALHLKSIIYKFVLKDHHPELRGKVSAESSNPSTDLLINEMKDPFIALLRYMFSSIQLSMLKMNDVYCIDPQVVMFKQEVFDLASNLYWSLNICDTPFDEDSKKGDDYDNELYEIGLDAYILSLLSVLYCLLVILDSGAIDLDNARRNSGTIDDFDPKKYSNSRYPYAISVICTLGTELLWYQKKFYFKDYTLEDTPWE